MLICFMLLVKSSNRNGYKFSRRTFILMDRKQTYLKWINEHVEQLKTFQSKESKFFGCFFYPYWQNKTKYVNSRWQEAALTFAWLYERTKKQDYKEIALAGINYWSKLQH